jgi:hypothetical protein
VSRSIEQAYQITPAKLQHFPRRVISVHRPVRMTQAGWAGIKLVAATTDFPNPSGHLIQAREPYKIDTATGQVWGYYSAQIGDTLIEHFEPVKTLPVDK